MGNHPSMPELQMILFHRDWARYPNAIWDTTTTNQSFLYYCNDLKKAGVKNYLFPLALMNPLLQGVDPHDLDNLTEEQMVMIRIECELNPWYFIREVFRVPISGGQFSQLRANRSNISLWWFWLSNINYFLIMIRQAGKSLNVNGITIWYNLFGTRKSSSTILTKDMKLIVKNVTDLKNIRDGLPAYLVNITTKDSDNQTEFTYAARGNKTIFVQAQGSEQAARNTGRGHTSEYIQVDEHAFIRFNWISIPALLASTTAARENAERLGLPYGSIFTTTAGMIDDPMGEYSYNMKESGCKVSEKYYDATDRKDILATVIANSPRGMSMVTGEYTHRQLGLTDAWLSKTLAEQGASGDEARRDFLGVWTRGSDNNPIDKATLEIIRKSVTAPVYVEIDPKFKYTINWFIPEFEVANGVPNRTLIAGLDTSNATGSDNVGLVIIDASTLEVVGTARINDTNLHSFAKWIAKLFATYPTMTLIPENHSTWPVIFDIITHELYRLNIDPGKRIFSTVVDRASNSDLEKDLYGSFSDNARNHQDHYNPFRKHFGFKTDKDGRELLYNTVMFETLKTAAGLIRDESLNAELNGLIVKNRRIDHASNGNDDLIFAWLLANWMLTYGKNLKHYGIDPVVVKRSVYEHAAGHDPVKRRAIREQEEYRNELIELLNSSPRMNDLFSAQRRRDKLNSLYANLDDAETVVPTESFDKLAKEASDARHLQVRSSSSGYDSNKYTNLLQNGAFSSSGYTNHVVYC